MSNLDRQWAGQISGTNTGNIFLLLDSTTNPITGTFRFLDDKYGIAVYAVTGEFNKFNKRLKLKGIPSSVSSESKLGELDIEGVLNARSEFQGRWESTVGTGGTFYLFPHPEGKNIIDLNTGAQTLAQFYTHTINLGALSLYENDVRRLIDVAMVDFEIGRAVVTYSGNGPEVTKYGSEFLANLPEDEEIRMLKINIQEPDVNNINKVVNIELDNFGSNSVTASGVRESWVIGKTSTVASSIRANENILVTSYKKFGLSLNQIIFFAMIVLMPSLPDMGARALFGIVVFTLLTILNWFHSKFIPNASINLTTAKASLFAKLWPTLVSWFVAASASLTAAVIFWWLTKTSL